MNVLIHLSPVAGLVVWLASASPLALVKLLTAGVVVTHKVHMWWQWPQKVLDAGCVQLAFLKTVAFAHEITK